MDHLLQFLLDASIFLSLESSPKMLQEHPRLHGHPTCLPSFLVSADLQCLSLPSVLWLPSHPVVAECFLVAESSCGCQVILVPSSFGCQACLDVEFLWLPSVAEFAELQHFAWSFVCRVVYVQFLMGANLCI